MLGIYLQQTTSADDIFRCIFLVALSVNVNSNIYQIPQAFPHVKNGVLETKDLCGVWKESYETRKKGGWVGNKLVNFYLLYLCNPLRRFPSKRTNGMYLCQLATAHALSESVM